MPYYIRSWRQWPQLRWLSRILCKFWMHDWLRSKTLKKPIICGMCHKKTIYYEEYRRKIEDP